MTHVKLETSTEDLKEISDELDEILLELPEYLGDKIINAIKPWLKTPLDGKRLIRLRAIELKKEAARLLLETKITQSDIDRFNEHLDGLDDAISVFAISRKNNKCSVQKDIKKDKHAWLDKYKKGEDIGISDATLKLMQKKEASSSYVETMAKYKDAATGTSPAGSPPVKPVVYELPPRIYAGTRCHGMGV